MQLSEKLSTGQQAGILIDAIASVNKQIWDANASSSKSTAAERKRLDKEKSGYLSKLRLLLYDLDVFVA